MTTQPVFTEWKATIEKYGNGGFVIDGEEVAGSVLLSEKAFYAMAAHTLAEVTKEIVPLLQKDGCELLIIGYGNQAQHLPEDTIAALKQAAIATEYMDTGAACRTYGIVQSEDRRAAALLIAV